jgi:hypothetical protein
MTHIFCCLPVKFCLCSIRVDTKLHRNFAYFNEIPPNFSQISRDQWNKYLRILLKFFFFIRCPSIKPNFGKILQNFVKKMCEISNSAICSILYTVNLSLALHEPHFFISNTWSGINNFGCCPSIKCYTITQQRLILRQYCTLSQKRWMISLLIMKCRKHSSYRMKLFIP